MKITFLHSGESPDFGIFIEGQARDIPEEYVADLIERGLAVLGTARIFDAIQPDNPEREG